MSLRSLRQRFKPDKADDRDDARQAVAVEEFEVVPPVGSAPERDETDKMSFHSAASRSPMESSSPDAGFKDADERSVFEHQLTQLQEQLVAVMIENQSLQRQVEDLEEKVDKDKTLALLDYERHRAQLLEDKCAALEKQKQKRPRKPQRSKSDVTLRPQIGDMLEVEAASEAEEDSFSDASSETRPSSKMSLFDRMWERILRALYDIMDDFGDLPHQEPEGDPEGDPLTVKNVCMNDGVAKNSFTRGCGNLRKFALSDPADADAVDLYGHRDLLINSDCQGRVVAMQMHGHFHALAVKGLKENIKRAGAGAKPYFNTVQGIHSLLTWKSPPYTLIVYMYSVWSGWFLPLFLTCLTFRLTINYVRFRGWNVNFNFFDCHEEEKKEAEDKDLGVSDRFNLVLQVARKVQNALGSAADGLEKIKSLFTWRHPTATKQLFLTLLFGSIASCLLPASRLFFLAGLYLGLKLFIVDYLYMRFPRLRMKYDSTYKLWQELPTDVEYEKRSMKSEIDRYILPKSRHESEPAESVDESNDDTISVDDKQFCELFSLPLSESPLPEWHGGRRCTLINREKSLTAAFKNGRLYLTHSFLCFERTKAPSPKNIVVPLTDITKLEKAKPYGWMPGGGMAIEVTVAGSDKPYLFGAMINRDEVYDSIKAAGRMADLSWACEPEPSPGKTSA
ncbi:hypothetical protein BaRGS_00005063 [Batillaria attramentaria]|uniref:GRAM domain-containing protein n=1 Tax=Batillaria attramentaria TaxID=370345 RepID=A0ABD0LV67_9CAEN